MLRICLHHNVVHGLNGGLLQNALLAEIIKVNAPNPQVLLNVINSMNMSPRLEEVPLPQGLSTRHQSFVCLLLVSA